MREISDWVEVRGQPAIASIYVDETGAPDAEPFVYRVRAGRIERVETTEQQRAEITAYLLEGRE